ncbi:MAG: FtsW/RodA/SpoVE family cell cycle protein [Clostridia bacterium]|nr:FtsW/RodA/SpoVE family cell cycle protein [Clostridia bacterium]
MFSATEGTEHKELIKQLQWFGICVPIVCILTIIDYKTIIKLSPIFYGIFIILLIAVLFTEPINGASSWFDLKVFSFQPAEFAKVFVICFIAYVMSIFNKNGKEEINKPWKLLCILLIVGVPVLLIVKQPDYRNCSCFYCSISIYAICRRNKKKIYNNCFTFTCNFTSYYLFICFT